MDKRQKDLSNYRITEANDSLKVDDHCLKEACIGIQSTVLIMPHFTRSKL